MPLIAEFSTQVKLELPLKNFNAIVNSILKCEDGTYRVDYDKMEVERSRQIGPTPIDIKRELYSRNGDWFLRWPAAMLYASSSEKHYAGVIVDQYLFYAIKKDELPIWVIEELEVQAVMLAL